MWPFPGVAERHLAPSGVSNMTVFELKDGVGVNVPELRLRCLVLASLALKACSSPETKIGCGEPWPELGPSLCK